MAKIRSVRGMNDIPPKEVLSWVYAEEIIRSTFSSYGYQEIRFPVVESTELFSRSNQASDMVSKEMYTFEDKGGDSISLRPEGTASCVRACIDNDLIRIDSPRLWYNGPMFRYERPQKGRSRQFHQSSVEVFGIHGPEIDAEIIQLSSRLWKKLGIEENVYLEINSIGNENTRLNYTKDLLEFFAPLRENLDDDLVRKLHENPLRILDSKSPEIQSLLKGAPKITDYLDEESENHFRKLINILEMLGISYAVNPNLVRGLDYYNKTVFEWKTSSLGSQDTVCAGGRYDNLIEELGGKACPAIGFSIGMERLILLLQDSGDSKLVEDQSVDCFFVCFGDESILKAMVLAEQIRDRIPNLNLKVNLGSESAGSQFKKADKSGARFALVLGDTELEDKVISCKDLREKSEQETMDIESLIDKLENSFKK
ncbi:MAG TPA: histidine--tRNA ligase [Gammaproteobacteria bacterium]|jgi:histidyl-tRNA synthetase|nr:histidine--tRNA ligase [Gammaproteobacteria bacterium]HIK73023.1 histidine--tRNA ligase [Gammaproteobacteria bacterium]